MPVIQVLLKRFLVGGKLKLLIFNEVGVRHKLNFIEIPDSRTIKFQFHVGPLLIQPLNSQLDLIFFFRSVGYLLTLYDMIQKAEFHCSLQRQIILDRLLN